MFDGESRTTWPNRTPCNGACGAVPRMEPVGPKYSTCPDTNPVTFIPVNTPSVVTYPVLLVVMVCEAIPSVFADRLSLSYDAVITYGVSLELDDPVKCTTIPFVMVAPDLFITKIRFSVVANENDAVSAYDAVMACEDDTAFNTYEAVCAVVTNDAVAAYEADTAFATYEAVCANTT